MTKFSARHLLTAAILSLGAILAPAASAASLGSLLTPVALLTGKADACAGRVLSQPFAPWNDSATYFPAPGGTFESGAPGWSLTGGSLKGIIYRGTFVPWLRPCCGAETASLGYAIAYVVLWGVILGEMSRRRIFIRI